MELNGFIKDYFILKEHREFYFIIFDVTVIIDQCNNIDCSVHFLDIWKGYCFDIWCLSIIKWRIDKNDKNK